MKIDFKGLLEGVRNKFIPPADLKEKIAQVHQERIAICKACPNYSLTAIENGYKTSRPDIFCTDCGCNLDFKTRCLSCGCPQLKWDAELDDQEEKELIKTLKNEGNSST